MSDDRQRFLDNLWRWKCGVPEQDLPTHACTLAEAERNWFPKFIVLMKNRMYMGRFRHGDFRDPNQLDYDRVGSALHRIHLYQKTGNGEHLVDAANLLGIEFTVPKHPDFHFTAIDDGYHTEVRQK
jgi:hypothetical protein